MMGEGKKRIGESDKTGFNNVDKLSVKWTVIVRVVGKSIEEIQSMDLQDK